MMPLICSRGMFVVPLKFMCSTQCDTPVRPVDSFLEPTLYQHQTDASGAVCTSSMSTLRPLSRTIDRMPVHYTGRSEQEISDAQTSDHVVALDTGACR